jgi:hypothetical protein
VRPDLRWAEEILGESLPLPPDEPPKRGVANPALDSTVIPWASYCYYQLDKSEGYVPCPYFAYTRYGSVTCAYTGAEAYDGLTDRRRVARHYGGIKKMEAGGVVDDWAQADSNKICGVNLQWPTYVKPHLEAALKDYADSVAGHRLATGPTPRAAYQNFKTTEEHSLSNAANDRLTVWKLLCSMAEEVPQSFIERLVKVDNDLRNFSEPSDDQVPPCWPDDLPSHANPQKQFWYFYRKNLMGITAQYHWRKAAGQKLPAIL